jgi:hypothetical protein
LTRPGLGPPKPAKKVAGSASTLRATSTKLSPGLEGTYP